MIILVYSRRYYTPRVVEEASCSRDIFDVIKECARFSRLHIDRKQVGLRVLFLFTHHASNDLFCLCLVLYTLKYYMCSCRKMMCTNCIVHDDYKACLVRLMSSDCSFSVMFFLKL